MDQRNQRIGTSMVLYITCIRSEGQFIKFWMLTQADFEKFKIVENKLVEYSVVLEQTTRLIQNQIVPGFQCAVKSKLKNQWCRARVLGMSDRSHVFVRLIDYGNAETVTVGDIGKVEDPNLNCWEDLVNECILADVVPYHLQWSPGVITYCEDSLLFRELNGSIISYCGNIPAIRVAIMGENQPFVQRLINMNLARIEDVTRSSGYKSIMLNPNTTHLVGVSYVESHIFYVQLVSAEVELKLLMDAIKSWTDQEQPTPINSAIKGVPCLARVEHKQCYYRALITSVVQGKCQVRFIDYGYSENKDFFELRAIPPMFLTLPAQAIPCSFPKDTPLSKEDFIEATTNKQLNCHVLGQVNEVYIVKLSHGDRDMFLSRPKVPVLRRSEPQIPLKFRQQNFIVGVPLEVSVSVLNDLDNFYCQLIQQKDQQDMIATALNSGYELLTLSLAELHPALPISVKFSEDKRWYRAEIIKVNHENHIEVFFVDFGNKEVTKLSEIRRLNSNCLHFPVQAFKCSLLDSQLLLNSPLRDSLFDIFEEQVIGHDILAEIKEISNETHGVKLYEKNSSISINEKLQLKAINVESVSVSNIENLFITSFESPESFFAQFEKLDSEKLTEMQSEIDTFYFQALNKSFKPNVGDFVCAKFVEDERYYRGKIEAYKGNNAYEVFFIDYGNHELVPFQDVHPINAKFTRFPIFGISCAFEKFPKLPIDSLKSLILENSVQANMIRKQNGKWLISLTENFPGNVTILEFFRQHEAPSRLNYGAPAVGFGSPMNSVKIDRCSSAEGTMSSVAIPNSTNAQQHLEDYDETVIPAKAVRNVYVSHVISPSEFYCQVEEESPKLQALMKGITETYENLGEKDLKFEKFLIGSPCCAKYQEDEIWYRAKIKATNPRNNPVTCDVFFVDYGNTDVVPVSHVRILDSNFIRLPPQALKCSSFNLSPVNGTWTDEDIDAFYEMFCDKSFVAQFVELDENDSHVVNLVNKVKIETESLSKEFLNLRQGHLQKTKEVSDPNPHIISKDIAFSVPHIRIGFTEGVDLTWILNPCEFYCQLNSSAADFKKMMTDMQTYYNTMSEAKCAIDDPHLGMICVTQFTQDKGWYRAEVQKVEKSSITVFYIDYGNSETVSKSNIRSVSQDFSSLPKQGIKCQLSGIRRFDNCKFTPQMAQKYFDGELKCKFISKENMYYVVDMLCNQVSVAQKMIKDSIVIDTNASSSTTSSVVTVQTKTNVARPITKQHEALFYPQQTTSFVSGQLLSVIVSYVENPGKFWCQLVDESENLDQIMASIETHYSIPENYVGAASLRVGSACIAKYSGDGAWYRAVVQSCPASGGYNVMFVDYGNSEVIQCSEVCTILPEFVKVAPQAFQCKLHKIPSNLCGKDEATKLFQSLVDEAEELTAKVETFSKDFCSVSLLYDKENEEVNVADALIQSFDSDDFDRFVSPDVPLGSQNAYISATINPHHFYVQLPGVETALTELSTSLTEKCESFTEEQNAVENPRMGLACSAKYTVDESWYRAEIVGLKDTTASVLFVDYGNIEDAPISGLKKLEKDFLLVPPYAIKCKLRGIIPKGEQWSDVAITAFDELVQDGSFEISFTSKELPASVAVSKDGKDVSQTLIDMELADVDSVEESCVEEQLPPTTASTAFDSKSFPVYNYPSKFAAKISYVDSFERFFVNPMDLSSDLNVVSTTLETLYTSAAESDFVLSDPKPSMPCAAKFSEDEAWYRAVITDIDGDNIFINFVDYGNLEVSTVKDLKSLTPELTQIPAIAIEGSLYGLKPVEGKEPEIKLKLEDLFLNDVEVEVEVCDEKPSTIKLKSDSEFVNSLVKDGLVELHEKPLQRLSDSETFKGNLKIAFVDEVHEAKQIVDPILSKKEIVGHVNHFEIKNDIVSLFVTLDEMKEALEIQQGTLYDLFNGSESESVTVKSLDFCAAKYVEDDSWYRAQVISCEEDVVVKFIDYGNSAQVSRNDIRELPAEYYCEPCYAIQCNLSGYKVASDQSTALEAKINELFFNGPINLTIGSCSGTAPSVDVVKVVIDDVDFFELMLSEELLVQYSSDEVVDEITDAQHVDSPEKLESISENLCDLAEQLENMSDDEKNTQQYSNESQEGVMEQSSMEGKSNEAEAEVVDNEDKEIDFVKKAYTQVVSSDVVDDTNSGIDVKEKSSTQVVKDTEAFQLAVEDKSKTTESKTVEKLDTENDFVVKAFSGVEKYFEEVFHSEGAKQSENQLSVNEQDTFSDSVECNQASDDIAVGSPEHENIDSLSDTNAEPKEAVVDDNETELSEDYVTVETEAQLRLSETEKQETDDIAKQQAEDKLLETEQQETGDISKQLSEEKLSETEQQETGDISKQLSEEKLSETEQQETGDISKQLSEESLPEAMNETGDFSLETETVQQDTAIVDGGCMDQSEENLAVITSFETKDLQTKDMLSQQESYQLEADNDMDKQTSEEYSTSEITYETVDQPSKDVVSENDTDQNEKHVEDTSDYKCHDIDAPENKNDLQYEDCDTSLNSESVFDKESKEQEFGEITEAKLKHSTDKTEEELENVVSKVSDITSETIIVTKETEDQLLESESDNELCNRSENKLDVLGTCENELKTYNGSISLHNETESSILSKMEHDIKSFGSAAAADEDADIESGRNSFSLKFEQTTPIPERHLYGKQKVTVSEMVVLNQAILLAVIPLDSVMELESLQTLLQEVYSLESEPPKEVFTSNLYAVKSKQGIWNRARVLEERESTLTVLFIDNGSSETLDRSSMRELEDHHRNIPPFAIWCTLTNASCLASHEEVKNEIKSLLSDAEVTVEVIEDGEPYRVNLLIDDQNILTQLASKNLISHVLEKSYVEPGYYKAMVSHVNKESNPIKFYVNLVLQLKDLNKLKENMQSSYETRNENLTDLTVSNSNFYAICHNDTWCRCSLISDSDKLIVRLIDTGELVETNLNSLRPLSPEHYQEPPCAIPCYLPAYDSISDNFSDSFSTLVDSREVEVHCEDDNTEDNLCQMRATFQDEKVLDELKAAGLITLSDTEVSETSIVPVKSSLFDSEKTVTENNSNITIADEKTNGEKCTSADDVKVLGESFEET